MKHTLTLIALLISLNGYGQTKGKVIKMPGYGLKVGHTYTFSKYDPRLGHYTVDLTTGDTIITDTRKPSEIPVPKLPQ